MGGVGANYAACASHQLKLAPASSGAPECIPAHHSASQCITAHYSAAQYPVHQSAQACNGLKFMVESPLRAAYTYLATHCTTLSYTG